MICTPEELNAKAYYHFRVNLSVMLASEWNTECRIIDYAATLRYLHQGHWPRLCPLSCRRLLNALRNLPFQVNLKIINWDVKFPIRTVKVIFISKMDKNQMVQYLWGRSCHFILSDCYKVTTYWFLAVSISPFFSSPFVPLKSKSNEVEHYHRVTDTNVYDHYLYKIFLIVKKGSVSVNTSI